MERVLSKDNRAYLMGVSIIGIILGHWGFFGDYFWHHGGFANRIFDCGDMGVDVFFFLSSYGLCFSCEKNSNRAYYKNRIKRLFPIVILFYVLVLLVFPNGESLKQNGLLIIKQLTGLILFERTTIEWYIPALIVLYALFPLLYNCSRFCLSHFSWKIFTLFLPILMYISVYSTNWIYDNFPLRYPIVALGIFTFFQRKNEQKLSAIYIVAFVLALLLGNKRILLSMSIPLVLMALSRCSYIFPLKKAICFIGSWSLEIYLSQQFATRYFFERYYIYNDYVMYLLSLLVIIVLSVILHYSQKQFWSLVSNPINKL